MRCFSLLFLVFPLVCFAHNAEEMGIRRVQAHLLIEDSPAALKEAEELVRKFPHSRHAGSAYIEALAASGLEEQALAFWDHLSVEYPDLTSDRHLLEELAWGVLRKGIDSTQYGVRLAGLIGAYLTRDVRAVSILIKMMRDSNVVVRAVAVQMASAFQDAPLKDEIAKMMAHEKVWMVRLELIQAIGALRMREMTQELQAIVQSDKATYEERSLAIESLLAIYETVSLEEWKRLSESNRAGLRHLACSIAAHFEIDAAQEGVIALLRDSHPHVRIAALNAVGLFYHKKLSKEEISKHLVLALKDLTPEVAMTAAWVAMRAGLFEEGEVHFEKWLRDSLPETRRFAAAALAATGKRGARLAAQMLRESSDPYVKANLALGLIGQREEVALSCDTIYAFLEQEKRMWMWDRRQNPLFQVLAPSQVRHVDHIPNYPEAVDQMTRLNLASLLALAEDPRAQEALKGFLQKRAWGITGVAAATLLQEGDESALEVVRDLLEDPDPNIRLQASLALAMLGRDPSVLVELQKAYTGADHEKKLHILEAMGRVASVETFHFLISALKEPFPMLRVAAAAALIQSLNR